MLIQPEVQLRFGAEKILLMFLLILKILLLMKRLRTVQFL